MKLITIIFLLSAFNTIGQRNNYQSQIDSLKLKLEEDLSDSLKLEINYELARYNLMNGDYNKSLEFIDKATSHARKLSTEDLIRVLDGKANIYSKAGDYRSGIITALEVRRLLNRLEDSTQFNRFLTRHYFFMGVEYRNLEQYDRAETYFNRALSRYDILTDSSAISLAHVNLFYLHLSTGDLEQAKKSSIAQRNYANSDFLLNYSKSIKADLLVENGMYDQAIFLLKDLIVETKKRNDKYSWINFTHQMIDAEIELYGCVNRINELIETYELATQMGAEDLRHVSATKLSKLFECKNNFKEALKYERIANTISDSIHSDEKIVQLKNQENRLKELRDSTNHANELTRKNQQMILDKNRLKLSEAENEKNKQLKYFLFIGLVAALIFGGFIYSRFRVTIKQKGIIAAQKEQVDAAYEELEEKNTEILDSINYAKRIQSAILPPDKLVKAYLQSSFILYKPKDIVAGDFYWLEPINDATLFAAADCTGHGVPGAMVSVVCNNGLNRSVREHGLTDPGQILDKTREIVISEFEKSEEDVKDGMDVALCSLNGNTLKYAGANNPLWIIRKESKEVEEIKANKQPIGKFDEPLPYSTHIVDLNLGDSFYIFSDGYADQFGGEKGKKFKAANFKRLLLSIQNESMARQCELIDKAFENWKGSFEQLDDVCVIGVRV